ncbi:MAG: hypothetical protein PWP76_428 [Candidatus Diapherotrites archaeon]|nr:hypothetical protein [Candidatus Diapherotrites archaeon]MDN5367123.1 hypothetical protein [Candidatus Diapherotrites archaeon]
MTYPEAREWARQFIQHSAMSRIKDIATEMDRFVTRMEILRRHILPRRLEYYGIPVSEISKLVATMHLCRMPTRTLREIITVIPDTKQVTFDVNVDDMKGITAGYGSRRDPEIEVEGELSVALETLQLKAKKDDPVARFLADYLEGEAMFDLPMQEDFKVGNPVHMLAASRIKIEPNLALAADVLWATEGKKP